MLPNIKNPTDTKIKKKQTTISFLEFLKINKAGKGQFIVPFKNKDEFDRLLKLLSREA